MPVQPTLLDGAVVAERLKKLRPRVPIIMLSAELSAPPQARPSIDTFVAKGPSPAVLLSTTASLLRLRSHAHPELEGKYIAFVDERRRYLDVTDGVCELLSYTRAELLEMTIASGDGSQFAAEDGAAFSAISF